MPATQTGSNGSLSADFVGQFDHAHDQAKSVFAVQKEPLDTLEHINEYWLSRVKSEAEFATTIANKLVTKITEVKVAQAFFDGQLNAITDKFPDNATWNDFCTKMENSQWGLASTVLDVL